MGLRTCYSQILTYWHIEYLKLEEFEDQQVTSLFSHKQVIRPCVRDALPIPKGKDPFSGGSWGRI